MIEEKFFLISSTINKNFWYNKNKKCNKLRANEDKVIIYLNYKEIIHTIISRDFLSRFIKI